MTGTGAVPVVSAAKKEDDEDQWSDVEDDVKVSKTVEMFWFVASIKFTITYG